MLLGYELSRNKWVDDVWDGELESEGRRRDRHGILRLQTISPRLSLRIQLECPVVLIHLHLPRMDSPGSLLTSL